jgi:pimeloyl-ACP methyl ester carboxylesterase
MRGTGGGETKVSPPFATQFGPVGALTLPSARAHHRDVVATLAEALRVTSADGTPIGCLRIGSGPPLVLVHGTGASHARWLPLFQRLSEEFTVYAMDRRGRGLSGDRSPHSIEREFEDVAAVVDAIYEPVNLVGHGYGAVCALEASLLTRNVRRLVLYEPPIPRGLPNRPHGLEERMRERIAAGDPEGVLVTYLREVHRMPEQEITALRASPAWEPRLATVLTLPREVRVEDSYRFLSDRFEAFTTPTLVLSGGASTPFLQEAAGSVGAALPNVRVEPVMGHQHLAIDKAPEHFVDKVIRFVKEPAAPQFVAG